MLNVKKIIMTSYFQNGAKNSFFEILSTLARCCAPGCHFDIKTGIYFILYPIIYQNMKTELNNHSHLFVFVVLCTPSAYPFGFFDCLWFRVFNEVLYSAILFVTLSPNNNSPLLLSCLLRDQHRFFCVYGKSQTSKHVDPYEPALSLTSSHKL